MIIYKITNILNNMCYIGQTSASLATRRSQHIYEALKRGRKDKLHEAMRQYGVNNFKFEIIAKATNRKMLSRMERNYIVKHNSIDGSYNKQIRKDPCKHKKLLPK